MSRQGLPFRMMSAPDSFGILSTRFYVHVRPRAVLAILLSCIDFWFCPMPRYFLGRQEREGLNVLKWSTMRHLPAVRPPFPSCRSCSNTVSMARCLALLVSPLGHTVQRGQHLSLRRAPPCVFCLTAYDNVRMRTVGSTLLPLPSRAAWKEPRTVGALYCTLLETNAPTLEITISTESLTNCEYLRPLSSLAWRLWDKGNSSRYFAPLQTVLSQSVRCSSRE